MSRIVESLYRINNIELNEMALREMPEMERRGGFGFDNANRPLLDQQRSGYNAMSSYLNRKFCSKIKNATSIKELNSAIKDACDWVREEFENDLNQEFITSPSGKGVMENGFEHYINQIKSAFNALLNKVDVQTVSSKRLSIQPTPDIGHILILGCICIDIGLYIDTAQIAIKQQDNYGYYLTEEGKRIIERCFELTKDWSDTSEFIYRLKNTDFSNCIRCSEIERLEEQVKNKF